MRAVKLATAFQMESVAKVSRAGTTGETLQNSTLRSDVRLARQNDGWGTVAVFMAPLRKWQLMWRCCRLCSVARAVNVAVNVVADSERPSAPPSSARLALRVMEGKMVRRAC